MALLDQLLAERTSNFSSPQGGAPIIDIMVALIVKKYFPKSLTPDSCPSLALSTTPSPIDIFPPRLVLHINVKVIEMLGSILQGPLRKASPSS